MPTAAILYTGYILPRGFFPFPTAEERSEVRPSFISWVQFRESSEMRKWKVSRESEAKTASVQVEEEKKCSHGIPTREAKQDDDDEAHQGCDCIELRGQIAFFPALQK